jgi:hypothetical protein
MRLRLDRDRSRRFRRRRSRTGRLNTAVGVLVGCAVLAHAGLRAFGADTGPPAPRLRSAPPRSTTARSATFAFTADATLAFECDLDGRSFEGCVSPVTYSGLELGMHSFRVRARTPTGAVGAAAVYRWRIVPRRRRPTSNLPRPVLTARPLPPYDSRGATFAWSPLGGGRWLPRTTFGCRLDADQWRRCRSPRTYRGLAAGRHVFRVRAERRGRRSGVTRFEWTIELRSPGAPAVVPVELDSGSRRAMFKFAAEGAVAFECSLDSRAWTPCTSPLTLDGLALGRDELCVRGVSAEDVRGPQTCFAWTEEPVTPPAAPPPPTPPAGGFSISGDVSTPLAPGTQGILPLIVSNPNDFDILVSELSVAVEPGSSKPGCDGRSNLVVIQSNLSGGVSARVPANGSLTLPAQGADAPQVEMVDLPTNQDACKSAIFRLSYSGTARAAP